MIILAGPVSTCNMGGLAVTCPIAASPEDDFQPRVHARLVEAQAEVLAFAQGLSVAKWAKDDATRLAADKSKPMALDEPFTLPLSTPRVGVDTADGVFVDQQTPKSVGKLSPANLSWPRWPGHCRFGLGFVADCILNLSI